MTEIISLKSPLSMETLYIIDDDKEFTNEVKKELDKRDFRKYKVFNDVDDFKKAITENMYAAVIDFFMPKMNGMEVVALIDQVQPDCVKIIVSENAYAQLPLMIGNYKYVKYVCKADADYIDQILNFTRNHFEMIQLERKFIKSVTST